MRPGNEATARTRANRSGAVARGYEADDDRVIQAVARIAQERQVSAAEVSLAWLLQKPGITAPIIGPTKPKHLTDAIAALDLQLSDDEVAALEQHYATRPVMGMYFPVGDDYTLTVRDGE